MASILAHDSSRGARTCQPEVVTITLDGPEAQQSTPADDDAVPNARTATTTGWLGLAGMASVGAGAVHAAAIGIHAEHRQAAVAFAVLALAQLAWGGLALVRGGGLIAAAGALV